MSDSVADSQNDLLQRALAGDEPALAALFDGYRDRLRRMIRLRLDRRLSARGRFLRRAPGGVSRRPQAYRRIRSRPRDPAVSPLAAADRRPEADGCAPLPPRFPDAR